MDFFLVLVLIFSFFIFLFCLHTLGRDDFVLLRKNLSMERIFNLAFINVLLALFFARLFYVVFNPSLQFLNPFVFFLFPYFSGLSLVGGIAGGAVFIVVFSTVSKMPVGRLFDLFFLSLLCALPFGFLANLLLNLFIKKTPIFFEVVSFIFYATLFIFLLRLFLQEKLKDGGTGLLFLLVFSLFSLGVSVASRIIKTPFFQRGEDFVLIAIFLVALAFLIKQEKLLLKVKKWRKVIERRA